MKRKNEEGNVTRMWYVISSRKIVLYIFHYVTLSVYLSEAWSLYDYDIGALAPDAFIGSKWTSSNEISER